MIAVTEISAGRRLTHGTFADFAAAKAFVSDYFTVLCMEDDSDFADCADAFTATGRVLAIQPVGFKVA